MLLLLILKLLCKTFNRYRLRNSRLNRHREQTTETVIARRFCSWYGNGSRDPQCAVSTSVVCMYRVWDAVNSLTSSGRERAECSISKDVFTCMYVSFTVFVYFVQQC